MTELPPGHRLLADPDPVPFDGALALVRLTEWHASIPESLFRTAFANSASFGVLCDEPPEGWPHALVAYARVVTDRATYAYLCDVIVHPGARGRHLSHAMVEATLAHAQIGPVRRYSLLSRKAPDLYRRHGFHGLDPAITYLERYAPSPGVKTGRPG